MRARSQIPTIGRAFMIHLNISFKALPFLYHRGLQPYAFLKFIVRVGRLLLET